jgi:hypothetical protein
VREDATVPDALTLMTVATAEEIFELSLHVNEFLRGYVTVHDYVFRNSIRRVIPLPLVFSAIEWNKALKAIETVSEGLNRCAETAERMTTCCAGGQREYVNLLFEYVQSLIETVRLFKLLLSGLDAKSRSWRSYSWRRYKSDVEMYRRSVDVYVALGGPLGEKLKGLHPTKQSA